MRRTLESVAAERLNKLGKNPNIISNRQDLKIDQEALKDIVAKATPNPSRSSSEIEDISSMPLTTNRNKSSSERGGEQTSEDEREHFQNDSQYLKKSNSFSKSRIKLLKKNLNIPNLNLLRKSPSTPSKLHRKSMINLEPNPNL